MPWRCTCGLRKGVLGFGQADPVQRLAAETATVSARGSAFPTSSEAEMISRRAMNLGSSPAAIIVASQYSAASGSLPRRLLMNAETVS